MELTKPVRIDSESGSYSELESSASRDSRPMDVLTLPVTASQHAVRFNCVLIRHYERILGDHPSCSSGAPLSIGWLYLSEERLAIDEFERVKFRGYSPRTLVLSKEDRHELLTTWGVKQSEIAASVRQNLKAKRQRRRTAVNSTTRYDRWEEAFEKASRKIKKSLKLKTPSILLKPGQSEPKQINNSFTNENTRTEGVLNPKRKEAFQPVSPQGSSSTLPTTDTPTPSPEQEALHEKLSICMQPFVSSPGRTPSSITLPSEFNKHQSCNPSTSNANKPRRQPSGKLTKEDQSILKVSLPHIYQEDNDDDSDSSHSSENTFGDGLFLPDDPSDVESISCASSITDITSLPVVKTESSPNGCPPHFVIIVPTRNTNYSFRVG